MSWQSDEEWDRRQRHRECCRSTRKYIIYTIKQWDILLEGCGLGGVCNHIKVFGTSPNPTSKKSRHWRTIGSISLKHSGEFKCLIAGNLQKFSAIWYPVKIQEICLPYQHTELEFFLSCSPPARDATLIAGTSSNQAGSGWGESSTPPRQRGRSHLRLNERNARKQRRKWSKIEKKSAEINRTNDHFDTGIHENSVGSYSTTSLMPAQANLTQQR